MSNQRSGLRFRMPSWFVPASASSSPPPQPQKSSNHPTSTSPSTTRSNTANNASSTAAKQAPPSDEAQNRDGSRTGTMPQDSTAAQKAPLKPPGKVAQNSNSQSQTSKTKPDSPSQARRISQPGHDKAASPTRLNNQPSSPPLEASERNAKPVQLSPTAPLQLPSISEEPSQSPAKPEKDRDQELKSIEEADVKSSPPKNSSKAVTKVPQYEGTTGSEMKSSNEVVPKPHSPERSPQLATKDSSLLPTTTKEPISGINEKPVAANSPDDAKVTHNETKEQPTEQMPTSRRDSESALPTPGSNSSSMNNEREKIPESDLKQTATDEDTRDKESGSEELKKEQQNVAVEAIHSNSETKKDVEKSMPSSKQNSSVNDESHKEDDALKGEEFPMNNVSENNKPEVGRIKIPGDEGPSREERRTSVITLAGDNRGTSMEIISGSARSDHRLHIHRGRTHKSAPDTEEIRYKIDSDIEQAVGHDAVDMHINSNLQCINNAIMLNSSITQRDPGVHVLQPHAPLQSNNRTKANS